MSHQDRSPDGTIVNGETTTGAFLDHCDSGGTMNHLFSGCVCRRVGKNLPSARQGPLRRTLTNSFHRQESTMARSHNNTHNFAASGSGSYQQCFPIKPGMTCQYDRRSKSTRCSCLQVLKRGGERGRVEAGNGGKKEARLATEGCEGGTGCWTHPLLTLSEIGRGA